MTVTTPCSLAVNASNAAVRSTAARIRAGVPTTPVPRSTATLPVWLKLASSAPLVVYRAMATSSGPPRAAVVRPEATIDPSACTITCVTAAGWPKSVTADPAVPNDRSGLPLAVYRWTRKSLPGAAAEPVAVSPPTTICPFGCRATDSAAA